MTLRQRLVVVNLIVFLVTLVVLISVISNQVLRHFYEQLDGQLTQTATHAAEHLTSRDGQPRLNADEEHMGGDIDRPIVLRLLDSQGNVLQQTGYDGEIPVQAVALRSGARGSVTNLHTDAGDVLRIYTLPVNAPHADGHDAPPDNMRLFIQTAAAPEEALEVASQIRHSLYIGVPLALLFAGVTGFLAARRALRPLTVMTQSAAEISADSLTEQRLPIPRAKDELQALALAFNATLDRLAAAFTRQRRFTADASHELRTPVTAILGHTELALSRQRTPAAYQETLERILGEAERMQRMIGRLLALARAESGQQVLDFAPTDISELLASLVDSFQQGIEGEAVRLELHAPPQVVIDTDADSLTQIVVNLMENAIAHTEQGVVEVRLADQVDSVAIEIRDEGPGIAPEDLPQIFDQFYRADPSRQHKRGNVGLGLALAHELTHLLGGEITAANRSARGAVFTVTLPMRHGAD